MNWGELVHHNKEYIILSGRITSYKIITEESLLLGINVITNSSRYYKTYKESLDLSKELKRSGYTHPVICQVTKKRLSYYLTVLRRF